MEEDPMIQEAESFSPQKEQMLQNVTVRHNDDKENWGRIPHGLSHKHQVAKMGQRNSMSPSNETKISFRNELQLSSPARRVPLTAPRRDIINLPVDTPTRMKRKGERLEMNVKLPRPDSNRSSVDFWIDGKESVEGAANIEEPMESEVVETKDGETKDGETKDGETKDGETKDGETEAVGTEVEEQEDGEKEDVEMDVGEHEIGEKAEASQTSPDEMTSELKDQAVESEMVEIETITHKHEVNEVKQDDQHEGETNEESDQAVANTVVHNPIEETVQEITVSEELTQHNNITDALNRIESQYASSFSSLKEQLEAKKHTVSALLNDKASLVCHVSQLENLLKDTQSDLAQLRQMESLKESVSASLLCKADMQSEIARLNHESSEKQELLNDRESQLESAHQDMTQLQQDLTSSREHLTRLANELNSVVSENGELNNELSSAQEKLDSQTTALNDLSEQVDIKCAENEHFSLQIQELQTRLSSFEGKRIFTPEEVEEYENAMKVLESENQQLKDKHSEVISQLESSHNEETSLLKQSHNDEITQLEASYTSEISLLKESHNKEISSLQNRQPHDDKQVGELRSQIKHLNNELRNQESETENKLQQLSQDLYVQYSAKHEQKVAILKKGYEQKWSNKISKMESEIEKLTNQLESAKRKLSAERDEKARLVKLWDELVDIERSSKKRPQVSGIDYASDSGDF